MFNEKAVISKWIADKYDQKTIETDTVSGFDADQLMLDKIPAKAAGLDKIGWHNADAVRDDWGFGFDVVVLAGNILYNIVSNVDYKKSAGAAYSKGGFRACAGRICL